MTLTLTQMKEHSQRKRQFANRYSISMRTVQQCIEALITFGEANSWEFTSDDILLEAEDESSVFNQLINWDDDIEGKRNQVDTILDNISLLISATNDAYVINPK